MKRTGCIWRILSWGFGQMSWNWGISLMISPRTWRLSLVVTPRTWRLVVGGVGGEARGSIVRNMGHAGLWLVGSISLMLHPDWMMMGHTGDWRVGLLLAGLVFILFWSHSGHFKSETKVTILGIIIFKFRCWLLKTSILTKQTIIHLDKYEDFYVSFHIPTLCNSK